MALYVPWRNGVPGAGGPYMEMELGNLAGYRNGAALLGRGLRQEREELSFFWGVWVLPGGPWKKGTKPPCFPVGLDTEPSGLT